MSDTHAVWQDRNSEPLEERPLDIPFDNLDLDCEFEDIGDDLDDEIIFFNRQYLLIDGADERIDLIITDDVDSPTLAQMLLNGMAGENLYSILDGNGEHIPMVRSVEALVTATNSEVAGAFAGMRTWDDLKSYGIELCGEEPILRLHGWHMVSPRTGVCINGRAQDFSTTTYENGNGLRLETTLTQSDCDTGNYAASTHEDLDDLHKVIMLVQDGSC